MSRYLGFFNNGEEEEVIASRHADVKTWLVFLQDDELGMSTEILRVKAAHVRRVELIPE